jgi:2-methylcitrate dehydratase PrpD
VIHHAKRALLDYLACAISGSQSEPGHALMDYLHSADKSSDATVIGTRHRLSTMNAALANGTHAHAYDFDDGQTKASAHAGGVIFSAVLPAAEQYRSSARDTLLAAIVGYEVMLRISSAMHPASWSRGFHNTPIAGVFGATAGVARLLGLTVEQTVHALGHAGSFAGGLFEFLGEGADTKRVYPGKAARDGILCAEMAKRGITGPTKVLEGSHGFFRAFADSQVKWERLLDGIGTDYSIADMYFKPYPCCRHLHAIIEGIEALKREQPIAPADVKSITVSLYKVGAKHDHKHCDALLDAQMSIPVAAALAIVCDSVTIRSFTHERLDRADVRTLIQATQVRADEGCERIYPGDRRAIVELGLASGGSRRIVVTNPKGESQQPMTDADLEHKLAANCTAVIGAEHCARLARAVWDFEGLHDVDLVVRCGG